MAPICNTNGKRARNNEYDGHMRIDNASNNNTPIAPSPRSSKRSARHLDVDEMDITDDCFRILEQSGQVQVAEQEPVTSQSATRPLVNLSLPRHQQSAQFQLSKKRQMDVQPAETSAAEPFTPVPRKKWRGVDKRSAKKLADQERNFRQQLAVSSPAVKTPQVKQEPEEEDISCTTSILQEYRQAQEQQRQALGDLTPSRQSSEARFAAVQSSPPALADRRPVATPSLDNDRTALRSPERAKRKRSTEMHSEQVEREPSRRRSSTGLQQGIAGGDRQAQPYIKKEGYGFSYSDPSFQSFNSNANDEQNSQNITPKALVASFQQHAGAQSRSAFEIASQKSPPRSLPSFNSARNSQQANWSFSSTASTVADEYDDVFVVRDVGSFHVAKPQRILPCTAATREDTIRLKARAKVLLGKYHKSADVQTAMLVRLERMVLASQAENAMTRERVPPLMDQALKIREYLLNTQRERIATGELPSTVAHEIEWIQWVVDACEIGVMHMKTGECRCGPGWPTEDDS